MLLFLLATGPTLIFGIMHLVNLGVRLALYAGRLFRRDVSRHSPEAVLGAVVGAGGGVRLRAWR